MYNCIDFLSVCDVDKIGDFICQEDQNIPECGFDSGDCCNQFSFLPTACHASTGIPFLPCTIFIFTHYHHSSKFKLIFFLQTFNFSDCAKTKEIGDGVCNDENNNYICNFDAGDCCDPNAVLLFCYDCTCVWERTTYPVLTTRYSSTYLF